MHARIIVIVTSLCLSSTAFAQQWEPVGAETFSAIAGAEDGALLLLRYPGDILRSTDTGGTWQVVYHGSSSLTAFRAEGNALTAFGDSSEAVVSRDSGRTWASSVANGEWRTAPPPRIVGDASPLLEKEGESRSLKAAATGFYPLPSGTNTVSFADSEWWAVGEPGLICVWDASGRRWRALHRAPFSSETAPPPSPLLLADEGEYGAGISFSSAAHGAIAVGNRIYFTNDSAVTWSEWVMPDRQAGMPDLLSSFFLLSDTSALIGTRDGKLYYNSGDGLLRCDSILFSNPSPYEGDGQGRGILQIGWKDKLDGDLFVLTDSLLYSVPTDLSSATPYPLPLEPGERAIAASFPDAYTGFLLTDSVRRFDTLASDGRDTTIIYDTSKVYRSLDGGATWNLVLKNIPGLKNMFFLNTKSGSVCGANGLILHTEDTGSRWARAWTMTRQTLHDLAFVNETTGYAVGDSGVVLLTQTSGRFWRPVPPEPLFTHPVTAYTGVGFVEDRSSAPNEQTVYIVAQDRCYKAAIPVPTLWHPHWHWPERNTLSVSEHPNPASGIVHFDIRGPSNANFEPTLRICNVSGNTVDEVSGIGAVSSGEWAAEADLGFLPPGPYTAIALLDATQAVCKFLIEH